MQKKEKSLGTHILLGSNLLWVLMSAELNWHLDA